MVSTWGRAEGGAYETRCSRVRLGRWNGFTLGVRNGQPTFISKKSQMAGARERLRELKCGAAISPTAALRPPCCVCHRQVVIDHFRLPSPAVDP